MYKIGLMVMQERKEFTPKMMYQVDLDSWIEKDVIEKDVEDYANEFKEHSKENVASPASGTTAKKEKSK